MAACTAWRNCGKVVRSFRSHQATLTARNSTNFILNNVRSFGALAAKGCPGGFSGVLGNILAKNQPVCYQNRQLSSAAPTCTQNDADEILQVQFPDGDVIDYSYIWLRDSCLCPKCHEPSAKSRLLRMQDLPVDGRPQNIMAESSSITITWNDGHVSTYPTEWLKERGYSPQNLQQRAKTWPLPALSWGGDFLHRIPRDSFQNLITNDKSLHNWICNMEQYGFFLITDAPREMGAVEEFSKRIAFLRMTNYGKSFTVKAKIDPSNAAYTSAALGLHVDLPYYYYTPGVQMLHCIKQVETRGGENQFADGFYVAEIVKKLRPDYYKILCTSLLDFYDVGVDYYKFHKFARRPLIQFDTMGNMTQINYNNQVRDYFAHLPAKELTGLFKAMKFYDEIMYKAENHIQIKLKDGEIACFHNYRIMHGREGFQAIGGGERHYEGGYLDWDELHSRRRVLQEELSL